MNTAIKYLYITILKHKYTVCGFRKCVIYDTPTIDGVVSIYEFLNTFSLV